MARQYAASARRAIDRRVAGLANSDSTAVPAAGWIRAVRESLGMSAAQLGRRLGLTRQAVVSLEQSEVEGGIRLSSLRRVAEALDCRVVYALVPNTSLDEIVRRRASALATARLDRVDQTMLLEGQRLAEPESTEQRDALIASLIDSNGLWDED